MERLKTERKENKNLPQSNLEKNLKGALQKLNRTRAEVVKDVNNLIDKTLKTITSPKNRNILAFVSVVTLATSSSRIFPVFNPDIGNADTTNVLSVTPDGEVGNDYSNGNTISKNGKFVTFGSWSNNLVDNDRNGYVDVFIRNLVNNTTSLVSLSNNNGQGNGNSFAESVSDDGNLISFSSVANNLVSNDNNDKGDVFLRNRTFGNTIKISNSFNGGDSNGTSYNSVMTPDGKFIVFVSDSSNLVPGDTNGLADVFLYDKVKNELSRISVGINGLEANEGAGQHGKPAISYDGRYISFNSYSNNLVEDDTNNWADVFVYDRLSGSIVRVSVDSFGNQATDSWSYGSALSSNGRYVAFYSGSRQLVSNDTNEHWDAFVHDSFTNDTFKISNGYSDLQANGNSGITNLTFDNITISGDGRFTAFGSDASNLVPNDNSLGDIFVFDAITKHTYRASVSTNGNEGNYNNSSYSPSISADGSLIAFASYANTLVEGDNNTCVGFYTNCSDIFLRTRANLTTFKIDLPVHDNSSNFVNLALGNIGGTGPGRVNSWFDHQYPTYNSAPNTMFPGLLRWDGRLFSNPTKIGEGWYDGHNGIDFQPKFVGEQAFPAAAGSVFGIVNDCIIGNLDCGNGFGNQVWINHNNGYATLYGHLKTVSVSNGQNLVDLSLPLGVIGTTGRSSGAHLHFGVYFDQNQNGIWEPSEVVDPYGWQGNFTDPWATPSSYLWNENLWNTATIDSGGGNIQSPSGNIHVTIPAGLFGSSSTIELWETAAEAAAFGNLRSIGSAFWLNFLDFIEPNQVAFGPQAPGESIVLNANYSDSQFKHLNESLTVIYKFDESTNAWLALPTTVDTSNNIASAESDSDGHFDLRAPLLCPDINEVNDSYNAATTLELNEPVTGTLDVEGDEDWYEINLEKDDIYQVDTQDLANGVDALIEIYDLDGTTKIASIENSAEGINTSINFTPSTTGVYFIKVTKTGDGQTGCSSTYKLSTKLSTNLNSTEIFLPTVLK